MSSNERTYDVSAEAVVEFDPEARTAPPEESYAATVRFDKNPDESWSLGMSLLEDCGDGGWTKRAQIGFVSEVAPHERLVRGAEFDIFEGPHKVGRVRVSTTSRRISED